MEDESRQELGGQHNDGAPAPDYKQKESKQEHSMESLLEYERIVKMELSSLKEARIFFNNYAKEKGFSIRKDIIRRRKKGGEVYYRRFVCFNQGHRLEKWINMEDRQRDERKMNRCGCPVRFSVKRSKKTGLWYVDEFVDQHNHKPYDTREVAFLRSHRGITEFDKSDIITFESCGFRKARIMEYMEKIGGGFTKVGFTKKDLYNFSAGHKRERILNGDANCVLEWMKKRKMTEPDFWFDYHTDEEGCLTALFWTDGQAKIDYECFGDVVIFDSTYRVNRYNMPFIPFLGVNHHGQTILFGCGLVANECWESYKWLLTKLLEAHYQKSPTSMITDGCPSMAKAIGVVLPHITHRVCSWHTELAMFRNLHTSSYEGFRGLLYRSHDPEDFERKWEEFCKVSKPASDEKVPRKRKRVTIKKGEKNSWLEKMKRSKKKWASGFLRGKLLLGMKSNQRSESFNSKLHRHLDRMMYLTCLVEHYEDCLYTIRRNEAELDCKNHSTPVMKTRFLELEAHVASIFTHKAFSNIREEINRIEEYGIVSMQNDGVSRRYLLEFKDMAENQSTVECAGGDFIEQVKCSCMKFESELIPCRHILKVLVEMGIKCVPQCCIARRWMKSPKPNLPSHNCEPLFEWSDQLKRTREMVKSVTQFIHEEDISEEGYLKLMEVLRQVRLQQKKMNADGLDFEVRNSTKIKEPEADSASDSTFGVSDPKVSISRGRPKRKQNFLEKPKEYKCSKCGKTGHNKATCTALQV